MLLAAAVFYTGHMTGIRLYKMVWQDVIVIVPVVNMILFAPLWFLLPHNLLQASLKDMAVQAIYQGLVINILAMICVAYAIRHIGTITVALSTSFVPVTTALLAWGFLGEALNPWEIAGIVGCSIGLGLYAWERPVVKAQDSVIATMKLDDTL
jgi:drug/metabolite transporter (DMT)-like permease